MSNEDNLCLQDDGVEQCRPELGGMMAWRWSELLVLYESQAVCAPTAGICASGHQSSHSTIMRPAIVSKWLEVFVTLMIIIVVVVDQKKNRNVCVRTLNSSSHAGSFSGVTPIPFASSHTKPGFDFSTVMNLYFLFN